MKSGSWIWQRHGTAAESGQEAERGRPRASARLGAGCRGDFLPLPCLGSAECRGWAQARLQGEGALEARWGGAGAGWRIRGPSFPAFPLPAKNINNISVLKEIQS